jgi:glucokinase
MKEHFYLGLDIGATNVKIILQEIEHPSKTTQVYKKKFMLFDTVNEEFEVNILNNIEKIILGNNYQLAGLRGIGISSAAIFDRNTGDILNWPNNGKWKGLPLKSLVSNYFNVPVIIEDDANSAAFGEYRAREGRPDKNMAFITISTGIGCGLILNGEIFTGTNGWAGEIGHLTMADNGPLCSCGSTGCLQSLASGRALMEKALKLNFIHGEKYKIAELADVVALAKNGVSFAQEIFAEAADYIADAIRILITLLDISTFILGGGVMNADYIMLERIKQKINQDTLKLDRNIKVEKSFLIDDNGVFGALALLRHSLKH